MSLKPIILNLQISLSLFGKLVASSGFAIVYILALEMYPTSIRVQAVTLCSALARLGNPFGIILDYINVYWLPDPLLIIGNMSLVAGFTTVFLPKTYGFEQ